MSFNKPAPGDWKSVETYINNKKPLDEAEGSYIYRKEDMVTLRAGREHAWLDTWVERLLRAINCKLVEASNCVFLSSQLKRRSNPQSQFIFCSKGTRDKSQGIEVYYAPERIECCVVIIITVMILTQLIIPVYILYKLNNSIHNETLVAIHIGILLVFTLVFSAILSLFTRAKRHEILGASAA